MHHGEPITLLQRKRVIVRLAKLLVLCQQRRWYLPSLDELARMYACSTRTIRRDLEALEEAGVQVPAWRFNERRDVA